MPASATFSPDDEGFVPDEMRFQLFCESISSFVGFMDPLNFMEIFLPWRSEPLDTLSRKSGLSEIGQRKETHAFTNFIDSANNLCLKDIRFVDTHASAGQDTVIPALKPDIVVHKHSSEISGTDFGQMELWIQTKSKKDPFEHPHILSLLAEGGFRDSSLTPIDTIGQLVAYAISQFGCGLRTHCFSVIIFNGRARLLRWDRAGAIVTESFDYVNGPLLCEFFMRFDQLTPEQRGWDTTVGKPSDKDRRAARDMLEPKQREGESDEHFQEREKEFDPDAFVEYLVPNSKEPGKGPLRFVGPPLSHAPRSLVGRSTRGCVVYDIENRSVCYLKDTWRIDSLGLCQEGKTYEKLHQHEVANIAKIVTHGDVFSLIKDLPPSIEPLGLTGHSSHNRDSDSSHQYIGALASHKTVTGRFWRKSWCSLKVSQKPPHGYIHYRLVLNIVGRDLTRFRSTKELTQVMIDTIEAHWQAYSKARILHRDISVGNLMIADDGRGFLIDWDLSRDLDDPKARASGRTGSWQFMSAALLLDPRRAHLYSDDLESFLHTYFFVLLRFSETNLGDKPLREVIDELFNEPPTAARIGRIAKANSFMIDSYVPHYLHFMGRLRLNEHLNGIAEMFHDLYQVPKRRGSVDDDEVRIVNDYTIWYDISEQATQRLEKDGVNDFKRKLHEILELSVLWKNDAPSKKAPIAVSSKRIYLRRLLIIMQMRTSDDSSSSLSSEDSSSEDDEGEGDKLHETEILTVHKRNHDEASTASGVVQEVERAK